MFIELTEIRTNGNSKKIVINTNNIQFVWESDKGETSIFINDWDTAFRVAESYEEIKELIIK